MKILRITSATFLNSILDLIFFLRYSGIMGFNSERKLLAAITFNYHTIEKGLSMHELRLGFGKEKISKILERIKQYIAKNYDTEKSQFIAACSVLLRYYQIHQESNFDIGSYFKIRDFEIINRYADTEIGGNIYCNSASYFENNSANYEKFSKSRHSVRQFSSEKVDTKLIKEAVELAKYCPSACNRQAINTYYVDSKQTIDKILKIQRGLDASAKYVNQLLVISADRSHFFTSGERYQHFIDGGIFIQSLLLALHHKKIAACPLHWSVNFQKDIALRKVIGYQKSEKVVCLVAIGNIDQSFKVPFSQRKNLEEIFFTVK
ncbi:nitroreductase family protein [Draconibacterium orientale]|uniref:nitroreductase family protein n=1 Tax=Draconibacterium orientale TaxID=1168034 RepID=UPI002ABE65EC|nr:nitroreductase family protein [Draconibacterium orientale]